MSRAPLVVELGSSQIQSHNELFGSATVRPCKVRHTSKASRIHPGMARHAITKMILLHGVQNCLSGITVYLHSSTGQFVFVRFQLVMQARCMRWRHASDQNAHLASDGSGSLQTGQSVPIANSGIEGWTDDWEAGHKVFAGGIFRTL